MAALRPHLALTVSSIDRSIPFYEALFGVAPTKVRPGYAKFEVADPALNFTLNQGARDGGLGAFNHAGIQVATTEDVLAARERLVAAGLAAFDEMDTTCCYARGDKVWVRDPTGRRGRCSPPTRTSRRRAPASGSPRSRRSPWDAASHDRHRVRDPGCFAHAAGALQRLGARPLGGPGHRPEPGPGRLGGPR
jgi:predicted enzyme related to lactoylglutathione lyase